MRYHLIHSFLKWFGPAVVGAMIAFAGLVAALAQSYPGVQKWGEGQFDRWLPIVSAPLFWLAAIVVIVGYVFALIWTSRAPASLNAPLLPPLHLGGEGGTGGSGVIEGNGGTIIVGRGGKGGPPGAGNGGNGGTGFIRGDGGTIIGGDGGDAGQPGGRGGNGGKSGFQRALELGMLSPESEAPQMAFWTIERLKREYLSSRRGLSLASMAVEKVPDDWINGQLEILKVPYWYIGTETGYILEHFPVNQGNNL